MKTTTTAATTATPVRRKPRILRVWIEHKHDESPDTSQLGDYSNGPNGHAIDRAARGHQRHGECRYFHPTNHHNVDEWDHVSDADVCKAYASQIMAGHHELDREAMIEALNAHCREADYQRMERLQAGDWHFVGIIAKAEVQLRGDLCQTLHSGGLWGIESDSDADYIASVEQDELNGLARELAACGFGRRAITHALAGAERGQR